MLHKILLNGCLIIGLVTSILDLGCTCLLTSICLLLSDLFSSESSVEAGMSLNICLIVLVSCGIVNFRTSNVEISHTVSWHIQFDTVSVFIAKRNCISCFVMERWLELITDWEVLFAWHFSYVFHGLLDAGLSLITLSCSWDITELILGRWNKFKLCK